MNLASVNLLAGSGRVMIYWRGATHLNQVSLDLGDYCHEQRDCHARHVSHARLNINCFPLLGVHT